MTMFPIIVVAVRIVRFAAKLWDTVIFGQNLSALSAGISWMKTTGIMNIYMTTQIIHHLDVRLAEDRGRIVKQVVKYLTISINMARV